MKRTGKRTLTIIPGRCEVGLKIRGISFKSTHNCTFAQHLIRSDAGWYAIDLVYNSWIDGRTADIKLDVLVECLKSLMEELPFDKIKITGHYPLATAEELFKLVTTP